MFSERENFGLDFSEDIFGFVAGNGGVVDPDVVNGPLGIESGLHGRVVARREVDQLGHTRLLRR